MESRSQPTNVIGEMASMAPLPTPAEPISEIDPQWAQQALRDAESSFGEDGNWGTIPTEEPKQGEERQ